VDCDNEQNATLLFKSARNSSSNQTSLAVAVVEGQAGVAKAFRIGANLVLTKPINIEQAKGTLRVARGLLRKAEPAKPGAPAASTPTAAPAATARPAAVKAAAAPLKPISAAKPTIAAPTVAPKPTDAPALTPATPPAWPAVAGASSTPVHPEAEPLEIKIEEPPVPAVSGEPVAASPETIAPAPIAGKPAFSFGASGAASAPAPAKAPESDITQKPEEKAADALLEKPAEVATSSSGLIVGSAPSFSFGASSDSEAEGGGKKKIFIGLGAAAVIAAAIFGYTVMKGHSSVPASTSAATSPAAAVSSAPKPSAQPATPSSAAPVQPAAVSPSAKVEADDVPEDVTSHSSSAAAKPAKSTPAAPSKETAAEEEEPAPLVVKGGKVAPHAAKGTAAEVAAPSLAAIVPGATPPPNFVPTTDAFKPVLQTLNISQGVSQGLLLKKVAPTYPQNALHMRIEGTVELLATISKEGNITKIKVVSGDSQLTKAATDAVKQWKYKPYLLNGEPVEIQTQVTVNFRLPR
jgi:protein TonB